MRENTIAFQANCLGVFKPNGSAIPPYGSRPFYQMTNSAEPSYDLCQFLITSATPNGTWHCFAHYGVTPGSESKAIMSKLKHLYRVAFQLELCATSNRTAFCDFDNTGPIQGLAIDYESYKNVPLIPLPWWENIYRSEQDHCNIDCVGGYTKPARKLDL